MTQRKRLTDRTLKALKPAQPGKRTEILDALVPHLMVRVTDKPINRTSLPRITFSIYTRRPGKKAPSRLALGRYPAMSLEAAREKAVAWLSLIDQGKDPTENRRLEIERARSSNVLAVVDAFAKQRLSQQRQGDEVERDLRKELLGQRRVQIKGETRWVEVSRDHRWRDRPISGIEIEDVIDIVDRIKARGAPGQARHVLEYIKRLFNWAVGQPRYGLRASPIERVKAVHLLGRKNVRRRILDDDELRAVWAATKEMGYPYGTLVRMLALTGQRRGEAAKARWGEFDLDKALWTISYERMKEEDTHVVPLAPAVLGILDDVRQHSPTDIKGNYLFSTTGGRKPISGFTKLKQRLDRITLKVLRTQAASSGHDPQSIEMPHWVIHDLRRTARTHFSAIPDVTDYVKEITISHAQPGVRPIYDRWAYIEEKRLLLELWAKRLLKIVEGTRRG